MPTDVSNYCRKESGDVRITKQEWEKVAQVLEVSFDEIFEEDTPAISINYENSTIAENSGNFSTYHNIPESIIKNLEDFIKHLKEENQQLRTEIRLLQEKKE
ncbi:transcriptional regulator [Chryseobacterium lacus]|uniref:transcriptional regulator n=1 Tax=Chryseobacterium lacus TaxID=2058346 RepID=UPI001E5512F4|nr:transcriptional regulator [Chryseobacterium lacus]